MPDDANGNYSRPPGNHPVTGQTAEASQVNQPIDDLAAAMTRRLSRDGRAPLTGNLRANGHRVTGAGNAVEQQDYVTLAQVQSAIGAISQIPVGLTTSFMGGNTPNGWVIANGAELSRATYPALWAHAQASGLLATTQAAKGHGQFGPGNGATTFTVPNLYADGGYFIRPMTAGRTIGSLQTGDIQSHNHGASFQGNYVNDHTHGTGGGDFVVAGTGSRLLFFNGDVPGRTTPSTNFAGGHTPTGSVSVHHAGGSETRPRNVAYPVIIKA